MQRVGARPPDGRAAAAVRKGSEWLDGGLAMSSSPVWIRGGLSLRRFALNRFGRFAWESWKVLAPTALAQIPDPRGHFSTLGATAESQWADLWPELLEPDVPGEDYFHKAGRIEAAKMRAEEMIRNELLIPPAEVHDPDGGDDPAMLTDVMVAWRDLMVEDTNGDQ